MAFTDGDRDLLIEIKTEVGFLRKHVGNHEVRIRQVEKNQNMFIGAVALFLTAFGGAVTWLMAKLR